MEEQEEKDKAFIQLQMEGGMISLKLNVTLAIKLVIMLGNVVVPLMILKKRLISLLIIKKLIKESTLLLQIKKEEKGDKNVWYLDNGASNLMCESKDKFVELDEKGKDIVLLETHKSKLKGKIRFSLLGP